MSVDVLERQPFSWYAVSGSADSDWQELAEESHEILGYPVLAKMQAKRQNYQSLHDTMAELDVRPFTDISVRAYKEACETRPNRFLAGIVSAASTLSVLTVAFGIPALMIFALFMKPQASFGVAIAMLCSGGLLVITEWIANRFFVERKWVRYELGSYDEPIPEFALQTALDIKKRHKNVSFFVDALEESRLVVDPFLVMRVQIDGHIRDFYVEVWSESKFHGTREA